MFPVEKTIYATEFAKDSEVTRETDSAQQGPVVFTKYLEVNPGLFIANKITCCALFVSDLPR